MTVQKSYNEFEEYKVTQVVEAAKNLVKVKGRYHSELAYNRLVDAVNNLESSLNTNIKLPVNMK
jgi:hypothetical protein